MRLPATRYLPFISKYFPRSEWVTALAVCQAESGGNAGAANTAATENHSWYADRASDPVFTMGSYGLFQVGAFAADNNYLDVSGDPVYGIERLFEPETNVYIAAQIFSQRGIDNRWFDWGAFTNGSYKQYMADAKADIEQYTANALPAKPKTDQEPMRKVVEGLSLIHI